MIESLVVLALTGCLADGAELVCRFSAPANLPSRQVRLELACSLPVYLNGSTLSGGMWPRVVSDLLVGRGSNTLTMNASCAPAKLLVTPRVYIARILPEGNALSVTVVNALENTVSVGLSCRGQAGSGSANATIPASGQSDLAVALPLKNRVTCVMEKLPDALEGPYRFQVEAIYQ